MVRTLDFIISFIALILLLPLLIIITISLTLEIGYPVFIQERVGKDLQLFRLFKFRTMKVGTPSLGTHNVSKNSLTKSGALLRKTKLDELPQLFNVLFGEMSLVGPRPCLPNQSDVIMFRLKNNVFKVRPGITGISQLRKIDMSEPKLLAESDKSMIDMFSLKTYFLCIFNTAMGKGAGDRIN